MLYVFERQFLMHKKVNSSILSIFLFISTALVHNFGYSHPGGLDANDGHYNRKTGEYHKHVRKSSRIRAKVNPRASNPTVDDKKLSDAKVDNLSIVPQNHNIVRGPRRPELKLASWNIRILSDSSRNDTELHEIAKTLIDYDFNRDQ